MRTVLYMYQTPIFCDLSERTAFKRTSLPPVCIVFPCICVTYFMCHNWLNIMYMCVCIFLPQIAQSGLSEDAAHYFNRTFVSSFKFGAFQI